MAGLFSLVTTDRTREKGLELHQGRFRWRLGTIPSPEGAQALEQAAQGSGGDVRNRTSQLAKSYKAGMFITEPGARGIIPPNLHTEESTKQTFITPKHTYSLSFAIEGGESQEWAEIIMISSKNSLISVYLLDKHKLPSLISPFTARFLILNNVCLPSILF